VTDDKRKAPGNSDAEISDAEIEQEIRSTRKFSLTEAIGRSAGDLIKGASPITRRQQAEFEIEQLINHHLDDAEGALAPELLRRTKASEALLEDYDNPQAVLAQVTRDLLESEDSLRRFVIRVDAEWGRIYLERPHFESTDSAPDRDDPYTWESVRATLTQLLEDLERKPTPLS
jgi:hypothetical protein